MPATGMIQPIRRAASWDLRRTAILSRYVFGEFLRGWLLALTVITAVMFLGMGGQTLVTMQESGIDQIVQTLPLIVPMTLPYTVPFSLLVATTLAFGRLSADNEVEAIRTSGIHLACVIVPILLLAMALSVGIFLLNDRVIPQSWHSQRTMLLSLLKSDTALRMLGVRGQHMTFTKTEEDEDGNVIVIKQHIYIQDIKGDLFIGVQYREVVGGKVRRALVAHSARPEINPETGEVGLKFFNASIHEFDEDDPYRPSMTEVENEESILVAIQLTDPEEMQQRKFVEMSIAELREKRVERLTALNDVKAEAMNDPREGGERRWKRIQRHVYQIDTEIQQRYALSVSCITFALVAVPLGILVKKGNKLVAFLISVLLVILIYYPLLVGGRAVAEDGLVPAWACIWSSNAVLFVIGMVLMRRVVRQ